MKGRHGAVRRLLELVSVRPREGRPDVKDGPFTESKEIVGGFFIIEAPNVEEAFKVARLHPAAELGEQAGWGIERTLSTLIERCDRAKGHDGCPFITALREPSRHV